jgi:type I restriction enzyme M protein
MRSVVAPLKTERLRLQKEINRLTFEDAIADGEGDAASALQTMQQQLDKLHDEISPLQAEMNQLTRQFWVTKEQVADNQYDLSASRYRQIEQDEEFYEEPQVTLERLLKLEDVMSDEAKELKGMIS